MSNWIYEREFELRFLKSRGAAFQDLFADLMELAYPGDFVRIRSHGNKGDLKCDGYLASQKTVFQLYGPGEMRALSRLLKKIKDDYLGAVENWKGRMDRWIFVHNSQTGIPAQAVQLLDDFRGNPDGPKIEVWGFENLRKILQHLTLDAIENFLPSPSKTIPKNQINQLSSTRIVEHYWAWLAKSLDESAHGPHLESLSSVKIPIHLDQPENPKKHLLDERKTSKKYEGISAYHSNGFAQSSTKKKFNITWSLRKYRYVLILGEPGSGKSTLLRRYAKKLVGRLHRNGFAKKRGHTPILIDLWRFGPNRSLMDLISGSVKRSGADLSNNNLLYVMKRGYVILLFDGLDEVPFNHRRDCMAQINEIIEDYPRVPVLLASRPFPEPPSLFHCLKVRPLADEDIAIILQKKFGSERIFSERFGKNSPRDYVKLCLRPEVRQLCRTPLTIGMIITLLESSGSLPNSLFDTFDRFILWLLDWEVRKGNLLSIASAITILEETAYLIAKKEVNGLLTIDWLKISGRIISELHIANISSGPNAEDTLKVLLSIGVVQELGGEISFSHRSILEFCAARRIMDNSVRAEADSVSLQLDIGRFLCSKLNDCTPLLEEYISQCQDVYELMPLLDEANNVGSIAGRFESLFFAIIQSQELSTNLSYLAPDEIEGSFSSVVDEIVRTSISFKPKALSILKAAADGLISATQWGDTRLWFERVVTGLEEQNWPGAALYRRLTKIGFFEFLEDFSDDEIDLTNYHPWEELSAYLDEINKDDFEKSLYHLNRLAKVISEFFERSNNQEVKRDIYYYFPGDSLSLQMRLWPDE